MKKYLPFALLVLLGFYPFGITFVNAQYIKLFDFGYQSIGNGPLGDLISDGTFLYGTTNAGGISNCGTIFKIIPDGSGYTKLLDFTDVANGKWPGGSLIYDGTFLYGMTTWGGVNNLGTIFKIKPDGTSYFKLLDFAGAANGSNPNSSLISDGNFLYGMTFTGGTNDSGVVFKIKPDGTGYAKLLDFTGVVNGGYPNGSLISDGAFLYGVTEGGGINNLGTIFKIKPDGTGYSKLLDFSGTANGSNPSGDLISDGIFLYGMTAHGGISDMGVIFKIKPDGTGYSNLLDFTGSTNGQGPGGSLISDGTFLYGMTYYGGLNNMGVIFKIKPDGTGYSNLLDFAGSTNGRGPIGSLISDGTFLYGMTYGGGIGSCSHGCGVIFKYQFGTTGIIYNTAETGSAISPNPSSGIFTVNLKNKTDEAKICIYDVFGNCVINKDLRNDVNPTIDISNQPQGVYFVEIISGGKRNTQKIILE